MVVVNQLHFQIGMAVEQFAPMRHHQMLPNGIRHRHAHRACDVVGRVSDLLGGGFQHFKRRLRLREKQPAFVRQIQAACGAVKQTHVKRLFQRGNVFAHGGGKAAAFGGLDNEARCLKRSGDMGLPLGLQSFS